MAIGNRKHAGSDDRAFLKGPGGLANTNDDVYVLDVSGIEEGYGLTNSISTDATGGYRGSFYIGSSRYDFESIERFNITGTDYADSFQVGNGNDVVSLGGGNDLLIAGYGKDTLDGGAGIDGLNKSFLTATTGITVNLTTNSITASQGTIANFEFFWNVVGSSKNDVFISSQFRGNDTITGGDGNDRAEFKIGYDSFTGGSGVDTVKADMSWYTGTDRITTSLNVDGGGGYSGYFYLYNGQQVNFGTVEAFEVLGTQNNDILYGGNGNDNFSGNGGDDDIRSGSGNDVLDGGAGIDGVGRNFNGLGNGVTVDLAAGTLTGANGSIVNFEYFSDMVGTLFADTFVTTNVIRDDYINAGDGDDTATFYAGYDRFTGGNNTDRIIIDWSATNLNLGIRTSLNVDTNGGYSGYMYLQSNSYRVDFASTEAFTVTGTAFDDQIFAGNGDDVVKAGAGWDIVNTGGGSDTLDGGNGIDGVGRDFTNATFDITVDLEANTVTGIGGSIKNFEYFTNFITGYGADKLVSSHLTFDDTVVMGSGNDIFTSFAGHDRYTGGSGRDRLILDWSALEVGRGAETSIGADTDGGYKGYYWSGSYAGYTEFSSTEAFTLTGTRFADSFVTGAGNDVVKGGDGNDVLNVGTGDDVVDGGAGLDGFAKDMSAASKAITIDVDTGTLSLAGSTIKDIEYLADVRTGSGDDVITTSHLQLNDLVQTGGGNDTAKFFAGYDKFFASSGNKDTLVIDWSDIDTDAGFSSSVQVDNDNGGFTGGYYLDGGNRVDFSGVEVFKITGTANNDTLTGADYADTLSGGDGRDILNGGGAADTLNGQGAGDTINGGDGADLITGGGGSDVLTGGAGADKFLYNGLGDSGPNLGLCDRITDFETGLDKIDLSKIDANTTLANNNAFTFIGDGAFTAAGQLHVVIIGGVTYVQGNVDADLGADFTIRVDGTSPVSTDFVL